MRETGIVVDGRRAYVEPQAFVASGERLLLAGTPVYVWDAWSWAPTLFLRDSAIGVVIDAAGRATLLAAPLPARLVHDVRATAAGAGEWAVAFAEADPTPTPRDDPRVRAYWFGLTNGTRWTQLARLPVTGGMPRSIAASALVRTRHGFAIAVPFERRTPNRYARYDALLIEWDGGRTVSTLETRWAAYLALAATATGDLLLAVVRPDTAEVRDRNSLFVYRRSEGTRKWTVLPRLARGLGAPVRDPSIDVTPGGIIVTWRATPSAGGVARAITAESLGGKPPAPVTLGTDDVVQVLSAPKRDAPMWVLVVRADSTSDRLRVLTATQASISKALEFPSPFSGRIAAAWSGSRLVLTGGVASHAPGHPPVHSRLVSIHWRCQSAP